MRVSFLSEKSSALYANGIYLGLIDGFERTVEVNPADGVFFEILPVGGYLSVCFRLSEEFLIAPPPQITLYYHETGVAVYANSFLRADQSLKILWQERLSNTLLTLYLQGTLQLNLENETGFHVLELSDALSESTPLVCGEHFLIKGESAFSLVSRTGELVLYSEGAVLQAENPLKAEIPFHDSMGHTAVCTWENGKLTDCAIRTERPPTAATFALALFESALIGADIMPFLSPTLQEKAAALKEYLGDYRSVVLTEEANKIGLVYCRRERIFDVRYFRVEMEDEKIANIKPIE